MAAAVAVAVCEAQQSGAFALAVLAVQQEADAFFEVFAVVALLQPGIHVIIEHDQ